MNRETDFEENFNSQYFSSYYDGYRDHYDDLFESEKYFISKFSDPSKSYLDVGCATGGLFKILNNSFGVESYVGLDISCNLIDIAKKNFPHLKFHVQDGSRLEYSARSFDRVLTLGSTVHDQLYRKTLAECYRVANEQLFFDVRLVDNLPSVETIEEGFTLDGSGKKYPYIVINKDCFFDFLNTLSPKADKIEVFGYFARANQDTTLPDAYNKILMCSILITKGKEGFSGKTDWLIDLPLS